MGEKAKYYHIWKKGTPMEKSLLIKVEGNSFHSLIPKLSIDDILDVVGVRLGEDKNLLANDDYNVNEISEKRAFKKFNDYQRGINLPNLI